MRHEQTQTTTDEAAPALEEEDAEQLSECFLSENYLGIRGKRFSVDAQLMVSPNLIQQFVQVLLIYLSNHTEQNQVRFSGIFQLELAKLRSRLCKEKPSINHNTLEIL